MLIFTLNFEYMLTQDVNKKGQESGTPDARRRLVNSLREHLETVQSLTGDTFNDIVKAGELICEVLTSGHKILLCGNGGSAADAQHIAAELVGTYETKRRAWPAIAITTDTSALTAVSNDFGYEQVFTRQVEGLCRSGDLLVAISTSGKSPNVVSAARKARDIGCRIVALTGAATGPLSTLADVTVAVPSSRTARVQEAHITIGHLWCEMVDALD
jgi:D-sedoheptulose 7-phosphate isomerase